MVQADSAHKLESDFEFNNCVKDADVYIRMGFLRKLYSILCAQLLVTLVTGSIMYSFRAEISPIINSSPFLLIASLVASIVLLIAMHIKRHETPTNYILLFSFTIVEAMIVGFIVIHIQSSVLLQALGITVVIVLGLTTFTMQSKRDFSSLGAGLSACLLALIIGGFSNLFFGSSAFNLMLSIGGAAIFGLLLVFDTHLIMTRFSAEEYIAASITLYLDIINLFLYILRILQATNQQ